MIKRAADWYIEHCREGIEMLCDLWNYREDGHGRLQAFLSDLDQFWMRSCLIVFFFVAPVITVLVALDVI